MTPAASLAAAGRLASAAGLSAAGGGKAARATPAALASAGPRQQFARSGPSTALARLQGGSPRRRLSGPGRGSRGAGRPARLHVAAARWQPGGEVAEAVDEDSASSYYEILGVASTASTDEIKRAYRSMAKEYHPDISNDEASTEFAVFLNEVYETLLDPEKRAAYDSIAGFQIGGVNPFMDTTYEREMVFVDEFTCIGCRNCNNVCPSSFTMEEEWGRARVYAQGADGVEKLQEAIDTCPVSCIHWVTAPQLALLEETMSRMERVAAWLLMTGGGKGANLNVFVEAATSWEKRQAALRSKVEADNGWGIFRRSPAAGSTFQEQARAAAANGAGEGSASSGLGRGKNAATVAAAARRWRDYQRAKRNRSQRLLTMTTSGSSDSESSLSSVDGAAMESTDAAAV